ncbi:MAG: hypothetical protein WD768_10360 [Phycisphaeraceae bacterium]
MVRMNVNEAARDFASLIERVVRDGESVELEKDERVVARITPEPGKESLRVKDLNAFLKSLPRLGDDAEAFASDVERIRDEQPPVRDSWAD